MKLPLRWRFLWWHVGLLLAGCVLTVVISLRQQGDAGQGWRRALEAVAEGFLPLLIISVVSYLLFVKRIMQPISQLTEAARQIASGRFQNRVTPGGTSVETDELCHAFNLMAGELEASFHRIHDFTLNASHELKTPLTIIRAELERLLGADHLPPTDRGRLENCVEEIDRLTRILTGLSLLVRAETNDVAIAREEVDLAALVRESADEAEVLGQAAGIVSVVDRCDPAVLPGDRARLRQMLLNLTDNAVKYNIHGGRVIYRLVRQGGFFRIEVQNTGHQIPDEELPRVFDRFYRSRKSRDSGAEGTGLGLSIVKWIVSVHGGEISVTSAGGLNTFTVTLPVEGVQHRDKQLSSHGSGIHGRISKI